MNIFARESCKFYGEIQAMAEAHKIAVAEVEAIRKRAKDLGISPKYVKWGIEEAQIFKKSALI